MHSRIRLAALVAAGALMLTGCGSAGGEVSADGEVDGAGRTLNVFVSANSVYAAEQNQWFEDTAAQFLEETGARLEFETFASPADELTRIQTSVLSGQGPDVYGLGTTFTPTAFATGAFLPLGDEEWESIGGRDRFVEATLGISGPSEDEEVGVPVASRPFVMAYNTRMLEEAGIDAPATSWDELGEQAAQLTGDGVYGMAVAYADSYDPWKFIWAMAVQAGNPVIDGDQARIASPEVEAAYSSYFGWLTDDAVVNPSAIGWEAPQALASFAAGEAAFLPMTTAGSRVTLDASPVADEYAYAVMPTIPPGQTSLPSGGVDATSILSGDNWVVAQYSQNQDLAFALIEMITRPEAQQAYFELFGDLPTNAEAAEALQQGNELLAPIVESAGQSVGTPFTGAWGDTQLALVNVVVQAIPSLNSGALRSGELEGLLQEANAASQSALDRAQ